jgi:hypothetical protein
MNMRPAGFEPDPIELDPRPCGLCGLTIDRHDMVDDGEGPVFFCADLSPDEMTLPELERRAELRRDEDIAVILAGMEWSPSPPMVTAAPEPRPYRTPQATIDAFWYVVGLDDPDYLAAWLAKHPADTPHLLKIWKARQCSPTR